MKKNIFENKNKLFYVLIVMFMFFGLFLISTTKVLAKEEYEYELMHDFTIKHGDSFKFNYNSFDVLEVIVDDSEDQIIEFSAGEYYVEVSNVVNLEFAALEHPMGLFTFLGDHNPSEPYFSFEVYQGSWQLDNSNQVVEIEQDFMGVISISDMSPGPDVPEISFFKRVEKEQNSLELLNDWYISNNEEYEIIFENEDTFLLDLIEAEEKQIEFKTGYRYHVEISGDENGEVILKNADNDEQIIFKDKDLFTIRKENNNFVLSGSTDLEIVDGDILKFIKTNGATNITFYRLLIDDIRPAIFGQEIFVTNLDLEKDVEFFVNFFSAYDLVDGDVTDSIIIKEDNYTANKRIIDTPHKVKIRATDSSDNYTDLDFYIIVVDVTPPVISGNTSIAEVSYKNIFDYMAFKMSLNVSDNHTLLDHNDIEIMYNEYQTLEDVLGTYSISYYVEDESRNGAVFVKKIKVIDDVAPEINGPETITSNINTVLLVSNVTKQLTAWDEKDGNITNKIELIEDNYTGKGHIKGNYTLVYQVSDNSGNVATKTITIQRVDNVPPIIYVTDGVSITTTPDVHLTLEQIINILTATGQLNIEATTNVYVESQNYFGNEDQVGVYSVTLYTQSVSGVETEHNLSISVISPDDDDDGLTVGPAQKISDWIKNNVYLFVGILIAVIVGAYFIFNPKKKRRRR